MATPRRDHRDPVGSRCPLALRSLPGQGLLRGLRTLRVQILLWTILPITIFLLGLSFTDVYGHQEAMRAMVEERNAALAYAGARRVAEDLEYYARLLQLAAHGQALGPADPPARVQSFEPVLGSFSDGVLLVDGQGQPLAAAGAAADWSRAPWVLALARTTAEVGQPAYLAVGAGEQGARSEVRVAVAVPLAGRSGALVGALPLERSAIVGAIDDLLASSQMQAALVDGQDRPIYRVAAADSSPGIDLAHAQHQAELVTTRVPVPNSTGWYVVVTEPWHRLVPLVLRYAQATVLIAVAAGLISLLAFYFGLRYVTQPLQRLGQQANRVAWGDFQAVERPVGGVEEIADLQGALRQMAVQVRGYQTAMRSYVAAITRAQEEERLRLARELHDDTVQSLIALGQRLERAQKAASPETTSRAQLEELRQVTHGLVRDLRRLIGDLRPTYLDDLGLVPALEMLSGPGGHGPQVELIVNGEPRRLSPDLELAVYRIVQAALKNVEQHAQAQHATLQLDFEQGAVRVIVADDGVGFEVPNSPDELAREGHFGLLGMRERALLFGGWLAVTSQPGQGTRVEAYLPTA